MWDKEEILRIAEICKKHRVIVISDEIHSDLVYKRHYPTASLSDEIAQNTVAVTSVTKTFNLAGIKGANLIIPNISIRNIIKKELKAVYSGGLEIMSSTATKAAYRYGEPWLSELIECLKDNIDFVINSFENTKISVIPPEGTYLLWLDCRALNMCEKELEEFFIRDCGVWMNSGYIFGKGGNGFMRMNIACLRKTLEEAVFRIKNKLKEKNDE